MKGRTFLFMGRPGCGKDTQGHLLAEKIGSKLFSSGEVFRAIIKSGTAAGKRLESDLHAGFLMPIWFACYLFEGALMGLNEEDDIVFQGACRKLPEAELFNEIHEWLKRPYTVICLDINDETMKKRIGHRRDASGRVEDGEHAIQTRIDEFNKWTVPSIEFFKSKGTVISVNAEQPIEEVHKDVLKALGI